MQITKSQFQKLILLQAFLFICYVVSSFFTPALLPLELQTFVENSYERDLSVHEMVLYVLVLPLVVWALQNLVALYQFRSYAPRHLLYITVASTFFSLAIQEPFIYTSVDAFLSDTLLLLAGCTLALVFYSNLALEFKKPHLESSSLS